MAELQGDGAWNVFFSYCHKDDRYRQKIDEHLSLLKRQGLISSWYDHKITAGKNLDEEIARQLERAQIILLLVSSAFIASDYCFCTELQRAIERHRAGLTRVVPIIVKPCDWKSSPFGKLKALPRDGKPITTWNTQDEAYFNIAVGIREVIKELNAERTLPISDGTTKASSGETDYDEKASLSARLSIGSHLELLQQVGCPYLNLTLVCTSKRPAKIRGAELRIKGPQYMKLFQEGFGTDFGYTPLQGSMPGDNDCLGIHFIAAIRPNLPGGFKIERDEAATFILPGLGFPMSLFTEASPASISAVVNFLDGRDDTVMSGEEIQHQIRGLHELCVAKPYGLNPTLVIRMSMHVLSKTAPDLSAVGTTNKNPVIFRQSGQSVEVPVSHNTGLQVFGDFPELTAIGREALQEHCNEWLKTSIARQSRIKVLTIGEKGPTLVISNVGMESPPDVQAGELLHFPLDYLLNFLIERIAPSSEQQRLKAIVAMKRFNAGPAAYQQFKVSPRRSLGVKCKNPECGTKLQTQLKGYAGQPFITDIEPVICPRCGVSSSYEAKDFFEVSDGDA